MGQGLEFDVKWQGGFHKSVSICLRRRARQLPGDEHLGQENNTCEGTEVTVCLACVRTAESHCGWNRVGKVDRDGNGMRAVRGVRV